MYILRTLSVIIFSFILFSCTQKGGMEDVSTGLYEQGGMAYLDKNMSVPAKIYFNYKGKKVMTYTMVKKTKLVPPTERYLNIVKQGYKDCKLDVKSLKTALQPVAHLQR